MSKVEEPKGSIRAFIAVELPQSVKEGLGLIQRAMRSEGAEAKWVRPESIHLTLKFLGNISADKVSDIRGAIEEACRGAAPMEVRVFGTGAFPNERRPRVIWVGLEEPTGGLASLQQRLEAALKPLGFEPEGRPFKAHLTLARVKSPRSAGSIARALDAQKEADLGKITVDKVVLYQSTLRPTGAVYKALEEVALGEG